MLGEIAAVNQTSTEDEKIVMPIPIFEAGKDCKSETDIDIMRTPSPSISDNDTDENITKKKKRGRPKNDAVKLKRIEQIKQMEDIRGKFIVLTKKQKKSLLGEFISLI